MAEGTQEQPFAFAAADRKLDDEGLLFLRLLQGALKEGGKSNGAYREPTSADCRFRSWFLSLSSSPHWRVGDRGYLF